MKNSFLLKFLLFILVSSLSLLCLSAFLGDRELFGSQSASVSPDNSKKYTKVIIDAGHGGEDGGASSKAGLVEKDVNLSIAKMLADMLEMNGVEVIMTREDDRLLYDRNCDYKGRKKKLDLAARKTIADANPDAIFISIHMNAYPDEIYSGLQVWYSQQAEGSARLAELIQARCRDTLQKDNTRKTKAATSAIYLLDGATIPSVLVECGFLTNAEEAAKFESDEYRRQIAFTIFCSITEFLQSQ